MSDVTPNLGLPLIAAGQAQKHVTHNEALGLIDALVQLACLDKDLAAPPANPGEGDRYLVTAAAPTGAWTGLSGQVVRFSDGVWVGSVPAPGWFAYLIDEADLYVFTGQGWTSFRAAITAVQITGRLGINTTADATNRLALKSDAALFSWDDVTPGSGDMRVAVNKRAAARDAGLIFETGYGARALVGTLGNDDFSIKVSPDGTTFGTALTAAAATGIVGFPASPTAPTPPARDNSTKLATTAYADRGDAASLARTQVNDTAYAIQAGDRTVAVTALTAARTLTLPAASAYPPGATLTIVDESGACSTTRVVTVARAGASDAIDGAASAVIAAPYGYLALQSNGANKWTIVDAQVPQGPYAAYTPSVTAGSGTLTTVSATGRYQVTGKRVDFSATVTVTANGSGAGTIIVGLPISGANIVQALAGRNNSNGKMLQGIIFAGYNVVSIYHYDNTYPGADGVTLYIAGSYEAQ